MKKRTIFAAGASGAIALAALLASPTIAQTAPSPDHDLAKLCARVGNDDEVRPYSPSLQAATARAFRTLFPDARAAPDASMFESQANYRCMNGKIFVCFIGANLPCAKINMARANPGADAFCKDDRNADFVPAVAAGHDAGYAYRCRDGHAEIIRANWQLDARGFAKKLWTKLPDR